MTTTKLTTFILRHVSGGRTATITVDSEGVIVKSVGVDDFTEPVPTALRGFTLDLTGDVAVDLSAKFALNHDLNLTLGLAPIVYTDRQCTLLFTVVAVRFERAAATLLPAVTTPQES